MQWGDDPAFIYLLLILLFVLVVFVFNKSKNKNVLKKKISKKISTRVYSQQNFSSSGFWHGRKGLALTFWGFFIGGNILLNGVTLIVADNQNLVIMNLMFFMLWNVLAVMGVFNAANIYKAEKMKLGQSYTGATAAKIAVVLLILSGIGNLIPK